MKYHYMKTHLSPYPIKLVYRLFEVIRSVYYAWLKRPTQSMALIDEIKAQYWRHKARLGGPSLVHDIRDEGYHLH